MNQKTILITGSTDGIGLATVRSLLTTGHRILIHGRNAEKLQHVEAELAQIASVGQVESYLADLSDLDDVTALADAIRDKHDHLDVLINNAGILKSPNPITVEGLDVRFVVNTIAPYLLTRKLLPLMDTEGRILNLSSAAQSPVNLNALTGKIQLQDDMEVYAQSKLAITMWSKHMADQLAGRGPIVIAVNPGSLLGTNMVKEGFGVAGHDINIGADILTRLSLDDEFASANGKYFDNDRQDFGPAHIDATDTMRCAGIIDVIEELAH